VTGRNRNATCSFCRKSYRDVGPLVEGPGDVYICGECTALCQSIIDQEKRRRGLSAGPTSAELTIRERLDRIVPDRTETKEVLVQAGVDHRQRAEKRQPSVVFLLSSAHSSRLFFARALAHALQVPFAAGDLQALGRRRRGAATIVPLLHRLLVASSFDAEAAHNGLVYVDGIDQLPTQDALLQWWQDGVWEMHGLQLDSARLLFLCGGEFAGLDRTVAGLGRHPEQPITGDALLTYGVRPELVRRLQAIVRVAPLEEATLARVMGWVDFDRSSEAEPDGE
jgi:ATP-dependent Clp protease ATP-binding subunit ClpX